MQLAILLQHGVEQIAVNRAHAVEREEVAPELRDERTHLLRVAADDAFARRVDDEDVSAREAGHRGADFLGGPVHKAGLPRDRLVGGKLPRAAERLGFAGQVLGEQRRGGDAGEHFVARRPRAQGEEAGALAETVAKRGVGLEAERHGDVADERAERDLPADGRALVGDGCGGVPELCGEELAREAFVLAVLRAEDFGEEQAQLAAHVGEVIARAGEDEGDFAGQSLLGRSVEESVAVAVVERW